VVLNNVILSTPIVCIVLVIINIFYRRVDQFEAEARNIRTSKKEYATANEIWHERGNDKKEGEHMRKMFC
jgi:Mg2+/Co2+ transporter CorB